MRLLQLLVTALLVLLLCLAGCRGTATSRFFPAGECGFFPAETPSPGFPHRLRPVKRKTPWKVLSQTGVTPEQVLEGETGEIHYSYYLPENYDPSQEYPL